MAELQRKLEEKEYHDMIANIKPTPKPSLFSPDEYSSEDTKILKNQISAIINILFSMVSIFVAIFIWLKNSPDYLVCQSITPFLLVLIGSESCGAYFLLQWWGLVRQDCIFYIGIILKNGKQIRVAKGDRRRERREFPSRRKFSNWIRHKLDTTVSVNFSDKDEVDKWGKKI
jgi:hypothetical protein